MEYLIYPLLGFLIIALISVSGKYSEIKQNYLRIYNESKEQKKLIQNLEEQIKEKSSQTDLSEADLKVDKQNIYRITKEIEEQSSAITKLGDGFKEYQRLNLLSVANLSEMMNLVLEENKLINARLWLIIEKTRSAILK